MIKLSRSSRSRSFLSLGLLLGLNTLLAMGCSSETGSESSGGQNTDPNVYASSSRGSDDNPGTKDKPVATLAKAISLASPKKGMVYACAEQFVEPLQVQGAVHVMGGYDCAAPDWPSVVANQKTTLTAGPNEIPLKALASMDMAHFEGMIIKASDATMPGNSSIAVFAESGATLEFVGCEIQGGNGAAGAPGLQPPGTAGPTDPNDPLIKGTDGNGSCMGGMNGNIGGAGKKNDACMTAIGGNGGNGLETMATDGTAGEVAPVPNDVGYGLGGLGAANGNQCTTGKSGFAGAMGEHGVGATDLGTLDAKAGYVGATGVPGKVGGPGQGGGGGGGAIGKVNCYGAAGGGGGAGGCGGAGGGGGQGGGSSFAVVSLGAKISFMDTKLSTGLGGHGGDGGSGQAGGVGGSGGTGGMSTAMGVLAACDGGSGGPGGVGGTGGGGRGGHSVAIAFTGTAPDATGTSIQLGMPGKGGTGSGDMLDMSAGMDGELAESLSFDMGTK